MKRVLSLDIGEIRGEMSGTRRELYWVIIDLFMVVVQCWFIPDS